ncbi:MAG: 1-deoxy-D-xylulose-5-phosphate synthase [Lachnospiraceae bacterium]|nr:1-deoxy-D-xylulose-5-phosphate synthase [Lachnospiraceae bacterium]
MSILDKINAVGDIKKVDPSDYKELAKEIRNFLVNNVSITGGHLASNLGVVELTMALHLFLDLPKDKLIFDVGHQSYTHKILTGRKDRFETLRSFGGLSGFPKTSESDCDAFNTGHSSTSISVADGMVKARDLLGEDYRVVALIGDGALCGGMAYEALNNAGRFKSNMIIVLNDNRMSISENVGGLAAYLGKLRTNAKYTSVKSSLEKGLSSIPVFGNDIVEKIRNSKNSVKSLFVKGMIFENMGITYIGPIDGHNIPLMLEAFEAAGKSKNPVLVHVVTKKGKGYRPAEVNPRLFHGVDPFIKKTGRAKSKKGQYKTYTDIFADAVIEEAKTNDNIVAVCAAMSDGTGLNRFRDYYPGRFFDVGISEEHAVTFAAGMAKSGLRPVVAIYSTFLQRSYDQILHDVALNKLPVVFAVDRAGIVGRDGDTHQGIFDLSFLSSIPGLTVMAPKNGVELKRFLEFAFRYDGPVAIRYPRHKATEKLEEFDDPVVYGKSEIIRPIGGINVFAVGRMVKVMDEVLKRIEETEGVKAGLINARFINPIDKETVLNTAGQSTHIITCEENVKRGGYGEAVSLTLLENGYKGRFLDLSLPDEFLPHGSPNDVRDSIGFDPDSLYEKVKEFISM